MFMFKNYISAVMDQSDSRQAARANSGVDSNAVVSESDQEWDPTEFDDEEPIAAATKIVLHKNWLNPKAGATVAAVVPKTKPNNQSDMETLADTDSAKSNASISESDAELDPIKDDEEPAIGPVA